MKNGTILIDFANDAILEGKTSLEAIQQACQARFRPILMTTFWLSWEQSRSVLAWAV